MKRGYTLAEVITALLIIAIGALALFGVLSNALSGIGRVYRELRKTFEANAKLEEYFSKGDSSQVEPQFSTLTITSLATSIEVKIVKPKSDQFGNTALFIFEPATQ
ncbi:MAG: prepilin-type N-terminal cleavage/methylation domain-containing protein [Pseudothermotoga sp.]|uniref:type IV pilus modification PilV family protein n=1 Tax=Pseudothermotoga sp. TaxID=2033661 RepID=UPI0019AE9568|nr:prepilin-type N-terminal cleavage/methylation domain-containing protein [Pseudothermotoga sp.]MBC7122096.1 prepilin-type N-terminal cleavage/methylation domain-containing protein [Pseudothermotoga sp.]